MRIKGFRAILGMKTITKWSLFTWAVIHQRWFALSWLAKINQSPMSFLPSLEYYVRKIKPLLLFFEKYLGSFFCHLGNANANVKLKINNTIKVSNKVIPSIHKNAFFFWPHFKKSFRRKPKLATLFLRYWSQNFL